MSESNAERLQRIKERIKTPEGFHCTSWDEVEFLVELAEQAETFKKLHKKYLDQYVDVVGERNALQEENLKLKLEVNPLYSRRKLISQNKKYEQALKDIRDVSIGIPHQWAKKVLEGTE